MNLNIGNNIAKSQNTLCEKPDPEGTGVSPLTGGSPRTKSWPQRQRGDPRGVQIDWEGQVHVPGVIF